MSIPTDFQRTWHKDSHPAGMLLHLGPDGSAYMDRCEGCTLIAEIDSLQAAHVESERQIADLCDRLLTAEEAVDNLRKSLFAMEKP